jgi:SMODS and SLOG-associating 2TM effector domain 3/SMODS and SLOG-associating 2TM effector domain 1
MSRSAFAAGSSDDDLPALFKAADVSSLEGQRQFLAAMRIRLGALVVAAAGGVLVGRVGPPDWFAFVAVIAFALALVAELFIFIGRPERVWYEGRAVAESVKTLAWRFAVGGAPLSLEGNDSERLFLSRLREILTDVSDLSLSDCLSGREQITPAMRALREAGQEQRKEAYRVGRIENQAEWYARKGAWNGQRARRWRVAALAFEFAGIVVGVIMTIGLVDIDLLGVLAAIVATLTAWLQTKQHETLSRAYSVASQELAAVRSDWETERSEYQWAQFVDEAEEAISREHTLWRASRGIQARWERRSGSSSA